MKPTRQLWLILKKNFLLRRRQKLFLILEISWPLLVFFVVVAIRLSTWPSAPRECHYSPRALPSAGTLPFLKSFICNLGNPCLNQYEEISSLDAKSNSTDWLAKFGNDGSLKRVLRDLPHSVSLINFFRETLKIIEAEQILKENFTFRSFLIDHGETLEEIMVQKIGVNTRVASTLLDSSFNFSQLSTIASANLKDIACDATLLQQYLLLPDEKTFPKSPSVTDISATLCSLNKRSWSTLADALRDAVDSAKIARTASKFVTLIGDSTMSDALKDTARLFESMQKFGWGMNLNLTLNDISAATNIFPDLMVMLSAIHGSSIDLQFINNVMEDIERFAEKSGLQKWKNAITLSQKSLNWINFNFMQKNKDISHLTIGSIFGEPENEVENSTMNTTALKLLFDQPLSFNDAESIMQLRSDKDLKRFLCKTSKFSIDDPGFNCKDTSTGGTAWKKLLSQSDMSRFSKMVNLQKAYNEYDKLDLMSLLDEANKVQADFFQNSNGIFNSVISFIKRVRLEPLWRTVKDATSSGNVEGIISSGLHVISTLLDAFFDSSPSWKNMKETVLKRTTTLRWISHIIQRLPETPMTFGNLFLSPVTVEEFTEYAKNYLPTLIAYQLTAESTAELIHILQSAKSNPTEIQFLFCNSPGYANLMQSSASTDKNKVREIQDALCRFDINKMKEELQSAYAYDSFVTKQYSTVNSDSTFSDFYLAQVDFSQTVRSAVQRMVDIFSKLGSIDWSPVEQAISEKSDILPGLMQDPTGFIDLVIQRLHSGLDTKSATALLSFVRAISNELSKYGEITGPVFSLYSTSPLFVSSILETLSDPVRVHKLAIAPDLSRAFCNEFDSYFASPSTSSEMIDTFKNQRLATCQSDWTKKFLADFNANWSSSYFTNWLSSFWSGEWQQYDYQNPTEEEWRELSQNVSRIFDRVLSTDPKYLGTELKPVQTALQHFANALVSSSPSYYIDLLSNLLRLYDTVYNKNQLTNNMKNRWQFPQNAFAPVDMILAQAQNFLRSSSRQKLTQSLSNVPLIKDALTNSALSTEEFIINMRKAIRSPKKMNLAQISMNLSQLGSKIDQMDKRQLTKFALDTVLGSKVGNPMRQAFDDFLDDPSPGGLDSIQETLEETVKRNPRLKPAWDILKIGLFYFTGLARIVDASLSVVLERADSSPNVVKVLVSDLLEPHSPELVKAFRLLDRTPDVLEYLLCNLVAHYDKLIQLRQTPNPYKELCQDFPTFTNYFSDLSNQTYRSSDRKLITSTEMFRIICQKGEINFERILEQQYEQNPELFAAAKMTSQLLSNQPPDEYPVSFTITYDIAEKVIKSFQSIINKQNIQWALTSDSRLFESNYWTDLYIEYSNNILQMQQKDNDFVISFLDRTLTSNGFGPAFAILQYATDSSQKLLLALSQRQETLDSLLQTRPELRKFLSWIDSDKSVISIIEILYSSLIDKPYKIKELMDTGRVKERLCTNAWSDYLTVPPGYSQENVQSLITQFCELNLENLSAEAVSILETDLSSIEAAKNRFDQLKQEFNRHRNVDTLSLLTSLQSLVNTIRDMQINQPSKLGSIQFSWLDQSNWIELFQRIIAQASVDSGLQTIGNLFGRWLDDHIPKSPLLASILKPIATTLQLINWQLTTSIGPVGGNEANWADELEIGKVSPILENLRQLLDDAIASRHQLASLFDRLVRSTDPNYEFCTITSLKSYLQSDFSEPLQNALCGIDCRRLTSELINPPTNNLFNSLVTSMSSIQRQIGTLRTSWAPETSRIYGGTVSQWQNTFTNFYDDVISKTTATTAVTAGLMAAVIPLMPEPVVRNVDAVVFTMTQKLRNMGSKPDITLQSIFPSSPYLRQAIERILPLIPQILETSLWSAGPIMGSLMNATSISQVQSSLCLRPDSSMWWNQISYPTMTENSLFSIRTTVCWIFENWDNIKRDIEKELALSKRPSLDSTSGTLVSHINELSPVWSKLIQTQKFNVGSTDDWARLGTYERIIQRWKDAHGTFDQLATELRRTLEIGLLNHLPIVSDLGRLSMGLFGDYELIKNRDDFEFPSIPSSREISSNTKTTMFSGNGSTSMKRALQFRAMLISSLESALAPFADVGLDLQAIGSRGELIIEFLDRLENAMTDSIDRLVINRLNYLADKSGGGEQRLRIMICGRKGHIAKTTGILPIYLNDLCNATLSQWPAVLRKNIAPTDNVTSSLILDKLIDSVASRLALDPVTIESMAFSSVEKSHPSDKQKLDRILTKMIKNETAWWPSLVAQGIRSSRNWKPSTKVEMSQRITRISKLLQSAFGVPHDPRLQHDSVQSEKRGPSFDWSTLLRTFTSYVHLINPISRENGPYESRVQNIAKPLVAQLLSVCSSKRAKWSRTSETILPYLRFFNAHAKAVPGYQRILCSDNSNGFPTKQLYDYFIYHSSRLKPSNADQSSRPQCSDFLEEITQFFLRAASAVDHFYSKEGQSLLQCLRSKLSDNTFRSADKYLDVISATGNLLSKENLAEVYKLQPLVQRLTRSLPKDKDQKLMNSFLTLRPEFFKASMHFFRDAVEFGSFLSSSVNGDWKSLTFGKLLTAFERLDDWDKQLALGRFHDSINGQHENDTEMSHLVKGTIAMRTIQTSIRRILDQSYPVSNLLQDIDGFRLLMISEFNMTSSFIGAFIAGNIHLRQTLSFVTSNSTFQSCDDLLSFFFGSVQPPLQKLCSLSTNQQKQFWRRFIDQIRPWPLLQRYVTVNLETRMKMRGVIVDKAKNVMQSVGELPSVLHNLNDVITYQQLNSASSSAEASINSSLDVGRLFCGGPLHLPYLGDQVLAKRKIRFSLDDEIELRQLPSSFCRDIYLKLTGTDIGSMIWKFLKPIILGKLLVSPDNSVIRKLMSKVNHTFTDLESWFSLSENAIKATDSIVNFDSTLDDKAALTELMRHPLLKIIIAEWFQAEPTSLERGFDGLRRLDKRLFSILHHFATQIHNFSECISLNRFVFFSSETNLQLAAKTMLESGDMLAAVVFDFNSSTSLPKHVQYRIRMGSDRIPSTDNSLTSHTKINIIRNLQYLYGFVPLQQSIDQAIIEIQSNSTLSISVYAQEFPQPCYQNDEFKSSLRYFLALLCVIACLVTIGTTIRSAVTEFEQGLFRIMTVMGLNPKIQWSAWFISSASPALSSGIITTFMLKYGLVLPSSNFGLLLAAVTLFQISLIMLSYLVSIFFKKANSATAAGIIVYLISYLPFILICPIGSTNALPYWAKLIGCLSSPAAFSCALVEVAAWEERGVGLQVWNAAQVGYKRGDISFITAISMIIIDCIIYFALASTISHIMAKGRFSVLWCKANASPAVAMVFDTLPKGEKDSSKLIVGVSVKGLSKFYSPTISNSFAISDVSFDLYEGQVTTLLGHNGAGKTTVINLLTGILRPSSGSISIYGKKLPSNRCHGQNYVGLCPQSNVLHQHLTVREHLHFYGALKSLLNNAELINDVNRLLIDTDLVSAADTMIRRLSGGTRRRVCVAMAFCGGSKCVILDEPSAGVDPIARRQLWEIIERQKSGRTILLSTHYLDEAEMLSDRIAILHKGRLLNCSSICDLRRKFGTGCRLKLIKAPRCLPSCGWDQSAALMAIIKESFPNASLKADYGKLMEIAFPFGAEDVVNAPNWERLFTRLDSVKEILGVEHCGLRYSGLEEIFSNVCQKADHFVSMPNSNSIKCPNAISGNRSIGNTQIRKCKKLEAGGFHRKLQQLKALLKKRYLRTRRDPRILFNGFILPCLFVALAMGLNMLKSTRGAEKPLRFSPEMFAPSSSMFFSKEFAQRNEFGEKLANQILESPAIGPGCVEARTKTSNCSTIANFTLVDMEEIREEKGGFFGCRSNNQRLGAKDRFIPRRRLANGHYLYDYSGKNTTLPSYLLSTSFDNRLGGWSLGELDNKPYLKVWFSINEPHSLPVFITGASNQILQSSLNSTDSSDYAISTSSHPISSRKSFLLSEETILNKIADFGVALVLVVAFSFIPASLSTLSVEDRAVKQRQLQRLVGINSKLYWLSCLIWDFAFYAFAVVLACIIMTIFGREAYVSNGNVYALITLLLLYGLSNLAMMYHIQRFFMDSTLAFIGLFGVNLLIIVNTMISVALMTIVSDTGETSYACKMAKSIFLSFPQYALGDGLVEMTASHLRMQTQEDLNVLQNWESPFSSDVAGCHMVALIIQFFILVAAAVITAMDFSLHKRRDGFSIKPQSISGKYKIDCSASKGATQFPTNSIVLKLKNLTKTYFTSRDKKSVVRDVTLDLKQGECFGLLGVNGAGKTTILEMLTGGLTPTNGEIEIFGQHLPPGNYQSCGPQLVGYCPQQNTCDRFLTVHESITVQAMMLGYSGGLLDEVVKNCIEKMQLRPVSTRMVKQLSGGYQRLLCLSIALLGRPHLLVLDEPTSGMDVKTRRMVWARLLAELDAGGAIILSTHTMEDCEALCDRFATVINGNFRYMGALTELKSKFGFGYNINIWLISESDVNDVVESATATWPHLILKKHSKEFVQFFLSARVEATLAGVYTWVKLITANGIMISDFTIEETPLDQVFIDSATR